MKTVATIALKPGMELADDVFTYKNELLLTKNTKIDAAAIAKLLRHSIMCVSIKEAIDFATTHFEKVRLSDGFIKFEKIYNIYINVYKRMINDLMYQNKPLDVNILSQIYTEIKGCTKTGESLLDYLYNMLPSEDDITYAHCFNSALIAGVFGTWLSLPDEDISSLVLSGFLYDIGKLSLSPDLINKPGKLTDSEYEQMKTHTFKGFHMIKDQKVNENILQATLQHHERCDGTGYPNKLKDDDINMFAKIISIIDAYEAMTSARTYRNTLTPFQVIANFEKTSTFYSPIILKPILAHIANTQLGMSVRLNNGEVAEIILVNPQYLSRPLLKHGNDILDLAKEKDLEIVAIL